MTSKWLSWETQNRSPWVPPPSMPTARAVTGRIYLPKRDLTGMVEARFKIPVSRADPDAKTTFYQIKRQHYDRLLAQDIPGGAWFRHQVRQARKALHQKPGDVTPDQPTPPEQSEYIQK